MTNNLLNPGGPMRRPIGSDTDLEELNREIDRLSSWDPDSKIDAGAARRHSGVEVGSHVHVEWDWINQGQTEPQRQLEGQHIKNLENAMAQHSSIALSLQGFGIEDVYAVTDLVKTLDCRQLELGFCRLGPKKVFELVTELLEDSAVQFLDLSFNQVTDAALGKVAPHLPPSLKAISLRYNPISPDGFVGLLYNAAHLEVLDVRCCGLFEPARYATARDRARKMKALLEWFRSDATSRIHSLWLEGNGLDEEEEEQIIDAIKYGKHKFTELCFQADPDQTLETAAFSALLTKGAAAPPDADMKQMLQFMAQVTMCETGVPLQELVDDGMMMFRQASMYSAGENSGALNRGNTMPLGLFGAGKKQKDALDDLDDLFSDLSSEEEQEIVRLDAVPAPKGANGGASAAAPAEDFLGDLGDSHRSLHTAPTMPVLTRHGTVAMAGPRPPVKDPLKSLAKETDSRSVSPENLGDGPTDPPAPDVSTPSVNQPTPNLGPPTPVEIPKLLITPPQTPTPQNLALEEDDGKEAPVWQNTVPIDTVVPMLEKMTSAGLGMKGLVKQRNSFKEKAAASGDLDSEADKLLREKSSVEMRRRTIAQGGSEENGSGLLLTIPDLPVQRLMRMPSQPSLTNKQSADENAISAIIRKPSKRQMMRHRSVEAAEGQVTPRAESPRQRSPRQRGGTVINGNPPNLNLQAPLVRARSSRGHLRFTEVGDPPDVVSSPELAAADKPASPGREEGLRRIISSCSPMNAAGPRPQSPSPPRNADVARAPTFGGRARLRLRGSRSVDSSSTSTASPTAQRPAMLFEPAPALPPATVPQASAPNAGSQAQQLAKLFDEGVVPHKLRSWKWPVEGGEEAPGHVSSIDKIRQAMADFAFDDDALCDSILEGSDGDLTSLASWQRTSTQTSREPTMRVANAEGVQVVKAEEPEAKARAQTQAKPKAPKDAKGRPRSPPRKPTKAQRPRSPPRTSSPARRGTKERRVSTPDPWGGGMTQPEPFVVASKDTEATRSRAIATQKEFSNCTNPPPRGQSAEYGTRPVEAPARRAVTEVQRQPSASNGLTEADKSHRRDEFARQRTVSSKSSKGSQDRLYYTHTSASRAKYADRSGASGTFSGTFSVLYAKAKRRPPQLTNWSALSRSRSGGTTSVASPTTLGETSPKSYPVRRRTSLSATEVPPSSQRIGLDIARVHSMEDSAYVYKDVITGDDLGHSPLPSPTSAKRDRSRSPRPRSPVTTPLASARAPLANSISPSYQRVDSVRSASSGRHRRPSRGRRVRSLSASLRQSSGASASGASASGSSRRNRTPRGGTGTLTEAEVMGALHGRAVHERETFELLDSVVEDDTAALFILGPAAYACLGAGCGAMYGVPELLRPVPARPSVLATLRHQSPQFSAALAKLLYLLTDPAATTAEGPNPGARRVVCRALARREEFGSHISKADYAVALTVLRKVRHAAPVLQNSKR
eukprot:TRINITY_DN5031_c0_g1_i1.p1 TRINITY_DN5031_c0_g1~~TRINITY_DN5031_c0_g1_i1.p1  ORF type:complete len:1459 (+),score=419.99 TRINITY_DN5031_c0_g1_i1:99-4475(+)